MNYILPYIISAIIVFPISALVIGTIIEIPVGVILKIIMKPFNPTTKIKVGGLIMGIIDGIIMYFLIMATFSIFHQKLSVIIFLIMIIEAFIVYVVDGWFRHGLMMEIFIFIGFVIGIFLFY